MIKVQYSIFNYVGFIGIGGRNSEGPRHTSTPAGGELGARGKFGIN